MAKALSFYSAVIILLYIDYTQSQCTSDLLRDQAVDACNHINKRSALSNIYKVEDLYAKHHFTTHYKKLKREDFPDGGYLRIRHSHYLTHQRHSKKYSNMYDNYHNEIQIISKDSERDLRNSEYSIYHDSVEESTTNSADEVDIYYHNHHDFSSHRGRRNANKEIPIDYCCSEASRDICRRYSCH